MEVDGPGEKKAQTKSTINRAIWRNLREMRNGVDGIHGF